MSYIVALSFIGPIVLVLALLAKNHWFKGWKTNIMGTLILVLGGVQSMNLDFLTTDVVSALTAGSGVAVLIASRVTERVK